MIASSLIKNFVTFLRRHKGVLKLFVSVEEGLNLKTEGICKRFFEAGIYLLKVNNSNTRTWCKICSKLTMKTGVFIVNFEHISHLVLVFLLLTLNM